MNDNILFDSNYQQKEQNELSTQFSRYQTLKPTIKEVADELE